MNYERNGEHLKPVCFNSLQMYHAFVTTVVLHFQRKHLYLLCCGSQRDSKIHLNLLHRFSWKAMKKYLFNLDKPPGDQRNDSILVQHSESTSLLRGRLEAQVKDYIQEYWRVKSSCITKTSYLSMGNKLRKYCNSSSSSQSRLYPLCTLEAPRWSWMTGRTGDSSEGCWI